MQLINLLPDNYLQSPEVVGIQTALDYYTELLKNANVDFFDQLDIKTATWGLTMMEKSLDIKIDPSKTDEFRRNKITSKMVGIGTCKKSILINHAKAFHGCNIDVIEDNPNYKFIIKFNDYYRVPDTSVILEYSDSVEDIKPAHLCYDITFTYNWWGMNDIGIWNDGATWEDLRNYKEETV